MPAHKVLSSEIPDKACLPKQNVRTKHKLVDQS